MPRSTYSTGGNAWLSQTPRSDEDGDELEEVELMDLIGRLTSLLGPPRARCNARIIQLPIVASQKVPLEGQRGVRHHQRLSGLKDNDGEQELFVCWHGENFNRAHIGVPFFV